MNLKKTTAVLALVLVSALVCAQSAADFNVELTEDGEGVVITGYTGKVTAVRIPDTIEGFPVRVIGGGAFSYYPFAVELTSVSLPAGLAEIREKAFRGQSKLTSVEIPDSVTEIGDLAFDDCRALASVTLPSGLTVLNYGVFFNTGFAALPNLRNVTRIGESAFGSCKKLTTAVIPEGVTEIGSSAFSYCTALVSVSIPSTIKVLEYGPFGNCSALTTVTIPDSVKIIANQEGFLSDENQGAAFYECRKLNLAAQARLRKLDGQAEANEEAWRVWKNRDAPQGYGK